MAVILTRGRKGEFPGGRRKLADGRSRIGTVPVADGCRNGIRSRPGAKASFILNRLQFRSWWPRICTLQPRRPSRLPRGTLNKHLTPGEIADLLDGRLSLTQRKRAARHLLSGCVPCRWRLASEVPGFFREGKPPDARRWRRERERLARARHLIRSCPQGYDGLSVQQVRAFRGWPLVRALLQASFEERYRDIRKMRWLAYQAKTVAEALRPEEYGERFILGLQARAWAELGNAYRLNDELTEAEEAFGRARALLHQGTGDPFLLAWVAELEASLLDHQRRLAKAGELRHGVHRLYLELGDRHRAGRALVSKGISVHHAGKSGLATALIREGISLLDPARDPQLLAVCQQSLLTVLIDSGELREAGRLILGQGLREAFAADPRSLLKLRWAEGKILAGLGKLRSAERVLLGVRNGFLDLGQDYDAAAVGLELAAVWLRQGKTTKVRELSRNLLKTFEALGIAGEAIKAKRYLQQA